MATSKITLTEYFADLPEDRKPAMKKLRQVIKKNLPQRIQGGHELQHAFLRGAAFRISQWLSLRARATPPLFRNGFAKELHRALPHGDLRRQEVHDLVSKGMA